MNLYDYCKWRGDLSFKKDPFNEVDNMCFAEITYIKMKEFFEDRKSMTIRELSDAFFEKHSVEEIQADKTFFRMSPILLREMAKTERFASVVIHNYVSLLHEKTSEQFAAVTYDLSDGTSVIAFRGTDDTLVGWKEDMMLSYGDIASQYDAVDYLKNNFSLFKKYHIIGHSKGGYLALYASVHADKNVKNKIIDIYSDDGPGLRPGTYSKQDFDSIKDRYKLLVPENDGVGVIYEMAEHKKIVKVTAKNILAAHSVLTWNIEGTHVVECDDYRYESNLIRKVLDEFIHETTRQQRYIFVEELFNSLEEADLHNLSDFYNGGKAVIYNTLKKLSRMDDESKEVASKMMKTIASNIGSDVMDSVSKKSQKVKDDLGSSIRKRVPNKKG